MVCWYSVEAFQGISQDQLDFFTLTVGETTYNSNARMYGLGNATYLAKFFWYGAFAPLPVDPVTPPSDNEANPEL